MHIPPLAIVVYEAVVAEVYVSVFYIPPFVFPFDKCSHISLDYTVFQIIICSAVIVYSVVSFSNHTCKVACHINFDL